VTHKQAMPAPQPTRLFHITALANLPAICAAGALLSKNHGAAAGINYQNIAHAGAQGARAQRTVPNPRGGLVHDFVPFYFAPRSPMLYAINRGSVTACDWRQEDIVHFETTVQAVTALNQAFVFYDRNATLAFSTPYTDLARLDEVVAWDLITEAPQLDGFCQYWQNNAANPRYADRMERRQAEFLVKTQVPLTCVTRLGVIDAVRQAEAQAVLAESGVYLQVDVMRSWYF
jgi:ssDNA thymidine ADP-ribosyltransferase, DarT